jgi:hypothetical protein
MMDFHLQGMRICMTQKKDDKTKLEEPQQAFGPIAQCTGRRKILMEFDSKPLIQAHTHSQCCNLCILTVSFVLKI